MKCTRFCMVALLGIFILAIPIMSYAQPTSDIKQIFPKMYPAGGLMWKGETTQNTSWNKICEDKQGRIWFSGGDHWGTDRKGGTFEDRYDRPWGYGNTTVCYYDPKKGKAFNYWNLRSLAYSGDGRLYMLGGRDYDNPWLLCYDTMTGSFDCLGWPSNYSQIGNICADKDGQILMAENMRNSYILVYQKSK